MTLAEAHILLVDDEPMLRLTLGVVLRRRGAKVTEAANGTEALDVLRGTAHGQGSAPDAAERPFSLLLTDWHMPVLDGPAMLQILAREGLSLPTVMCTGTLGDDTDLDLPALGVQALLLKPFAPAELVLRLETVLAPLPASK